MSDRLVRGRVNRQQRRSFAIGEWCRPAGPARRGTTTVEFAMVSSILFLFVFGSFEFGRLQMAYHGLEASAREGCRAATSWKATQVSVSDVVNQRLQSFGISACTLTTTPNLISGADVWEPITVRVEVPYSQVSWLPMPRFLHGVTLAGSCTLPKEAVEAGS